MKWFLMVFLALILTIAIALPALAMMIDHPPVRIETREDGGAFSLTVENLPETFELNMKDTEDYAQEYIYQVRFCDGNAFYAVGPAHFKSPDNETKVSPLFGRSQLWQEDSSEGNPLSQCSHERDGDTVTFLLEEPIFDRDGYTVKIDYENIIAFGYTIQNAATTQLPNAYFRVLVGGGLEEISREMYYELIPAIR